MPRYFRVSYHQKWPRTHDIRQTTEPHSMAWMAGQRGPDRSGEIWCVLLTHWPCVERVVTDADTGLERGVKLINEARATEVEGQERATAMSNPDGTRRISYPA